MSLDSRLFNPRRSNSSSASSAFVSVGVSSEAATLARNGRLPAARAQVWWSCLPFKRAGAHRAATATVESGPADGSLDLLFGQCGLDRRADSRCTAMLRWSSPNPRSPPGLPTDRKDAAERTSRSVVQPMDQSASPWSRFRAPPPQIARRPEAALDRPRLDVALQNSVESSSNIIGACGNSYACRQRGCNSPSHPMARPSTSTPCAWVQRRMFGGAKRPLAAPTGPGHRP